MKSDQENFSGIQEVTTAFSLTWLVMSNMVGVVLAILLLRPGLNDLIAPFTYGRLVPVHMDWQLYGWCSLPLLGILYRMFLGGLRDQAFWVSAGLGIWSIGLLVGGVFWLDGAATGKLFLNWSGLSGSVFGAALTGNWAILVLAWLSELFSRKERVNLRLGSVVRIGLLVALPVVPLVLLYTSDPAVYPPVNPESGGATGHSLLASSLGVVFLMGLFPGTLLRLKRRDGKLVEVWTGIYWAVFAISILTYLVMHHGNASNREWNQILGLGTLMVWPILVGVYWSCYNWSAGTVRWRWAFVFWWGILTLDGWLIFLPGSLDVLKFTNALVAHSHLAMGGMVSALNILLLSETGASVRVKRAFSGDTAFWLWNLGCLLYVVAMTMQGWHEGKQPGSLYRFDLYAETSYTVRLVAGISMLAASINWMISVFSKTGRSAVDVGEMEAL